MKKLLVLLLLLVSAPALAEQDAGGDLLPPEQAFPLKVEADSADRVTATFDLPDGYYLYRTKFKFDSQTPGIRIKHAAYPKGKMKDEQALGLGIVEIFRHQVNIPLTLTRSADAPSTLKLKVTSQGCADIGVCYPPLTRIVDVSLPKAAAPAASVSQAINSLANSVGQDANDVLPPDQAYVYSLTAAGPATLLAHWDVQPGYYLYQDKLKFKIVKPAGIELGRIRLPQGKVHEDQFFGKQTIYPESFGVDLPLINSGGLTGKQTVTVQADYQGCAEEAGVCYPPMSKTVALTVNADALPTQAGSAPPAGGSESASTSPQTPGGQAVTPPVSEQDRLASFLQQKPLWMSLGLFFLLGLGLAFTPCVFPMIPILSGIIVGQKEALSTMRAFMLSLAYVLAMALTYTVVGVLAGLGGANLQIWFQNPWVLSVFAAVFVLLSLSMFGFYELQMPNAIQTRLTNLSNKQQSGNLIGAGIMGFLSALIVGPCVTAPLIGALIVISQTGDAVLGGAALFSLSIGMGAPLLVIGVSAGKLLPRAGAWMDSIKAVFGVLLLAVAIWMLERIVPDAVTFALSGILLIVSAIYLGALDHLEPGVSGWRRLWKGLGLVLLLYGAFLLVGAASGSRDLMQPLRGVVATQGAGPGGAVAHEGLQFRQIKGLDGLEQALAQAKANNQPVMLDFYADWCVSCKEMEKYTFTSSQVKQALGNALLLQTDVTADDAKDKALLKHFGLFGPPAILFFTPQGEELKSARVVGYMPPAQFAPHVKQSLGN
jgi:thiol:disulfide interchange protein DsbD